MTTYRCFTLLGFLLAVTGAVRADTILSYQLSGSQVCVSSQCGTGCFTPVAANDDITAPPAGINIPAGTFTHTTSCYDWSSNSGFWNATMRLTDDASGATVEKTIGGEFTVSTWNASVTLDPITVDVGTNRYTLTSGPNLDGSPRQATINVTMRDLSQPRPIFSKQPGTAPAKERLSPQPVVTVLKPDGHVATDFDGMVSLMPRPDPNNPFQLTGTTSVQAIDGIATFEDVGVDRKGEFTVMALAEGLSAAASEPVTITLPLGPDPAISYRASGDATYSNPQKTLSIEQRAGTSGNVYVPVGGQGLGVGTLDHQGGGSPADAFACWWSMTFDLKDEASREQVTMTLKGTLEASGLCGYGMPPITASLHPQTVTAGGRRYTFEGAGVVAYPHMECDPSPFGVRIRHNPPTQSSPVFATQPGGSAWTLTLDQQPVVEMRKPDGTLDTSFNGDVSLLVKPETVAFGTSLYAPRYGFGGTKVKAVNGVATFRGLEFSRPVQGAVLTAFATEYPVVDASPIVAGALASLPGAALALRIAAGLAAAPPDVSDPVDIKTAVSIVRQLWGY